MSCIECRETEARQGHWHVYRTGCPGCTARAVARSQAAFDAIVRSDPAELRDMLKRMFPTMAYADARALVWAAWQIDHPAQETT